MLLYGAIVRSAQHTSRAEECPERTEFTGMAEYTGVIHVHSSYSQDSEASVELIARAARRAGVDFVVISDHNTLGALREEGWHGNVLILAGEEVGLPRSNHYLALGITEEVPPGAPREVIQAVLAQGGFGFLAHPFFEGNKRLGLPACLWEDWDADGYTGLSLFDYSTDAASRLGLLTYLLFTAFPWLDVDRPRPKTLEKWNELLETRRPVAIGTVDAHLQYVRLGPIRVPVHPFQSFFRFVRTHIVTEDSLNGELTHDKKLVYRALQHGSCFVANEYVGSARGFSVRVRCGDKCATMGQEIALEGGGRRGVLEVCSPIPAELRLLLDGREVSSASGTSLTYAVSVPGVYRVEAFRRHCLRLKPWVYTNPVYVVDPQGRRP